MSCHCIDWTGIAGAALAEVMASPEWLPEWPEAKVTSADTEYWVGPRDTFLCVTIALHTRALDAERDNAIESMVHDALQGATMHGVMVFAGPEKTP